MKTRNNEALTKAYFPEKGVPDSLENFRLDLLFTFFITAHVRNENFYLLSSRCKDVI